MADIALVKAKSQHYLGSALVSLSDLSFENEFRKFDEKNVDRLLKIFAIEGCKRYDPMNHVPALITRRDLKRALRKSSIPLRHLKHHEPPYINLHRAPSLVCLHGFHRVAAAKAFLGPHEQWWILDLYQANGMIEIVVLVNHLLISTGMSREVSQSISEQYENSKGFDDGYIFQSLRHYQRMGDQAGENKWLARLSQSKRRDIKQLQRSPAFKELREALDDLLFLPALWQAFRIRTFHRLLTMRCNEHIKHIWVYILDQNPAAFRLLDSSTVLKIQGRCPKLSSDDQSYVSSLFKMREVFPQIQDKQLLSRIHKNISATDWIIPSLHTFLEDTKFLEPCLKILRRLLPPSYRGTIHSGLERCFSHNRSSLLRVERAAMQFINVQDNSDLRFWSGYRQLWLYALRNFPFMGDVKPRKNRQSPEKPDYNRDVSECWNTLGKLAREFRFVTSEIERLCLTVGTTISCLRTTAPVEPQLTTDEDFDWRLENRCGRMFEHAFNKDAHYLFLLNVYVSSPPLQRQHLTSFGTTAQIVQSFLGPSRLRLDVVSTERHAEAISNHVSQHANSELSSDIDMTEDITQNLDVLGQGAEIHTQQAPQRQHPTSLGTTAQIMQSSPGLSGLHPVIGSTESQEEAISNQANQHVNSEPSSDIDTTEDATQTLDALGQRAEIPAQQLLSSRDQTELTNQGFEQHQDCNHAPTQTPMAQFNNKPNDDQTTTVQINDQVAVNERTAEQEQASEREGQRQEALVGVPTTPFPRHLPHGEDVFTLNHSTLPHTPFPRYERLEAPLSHEPKSQKDRARKHAERRKAGMVLKGHRQPQGTLFIKIPARGLSPSSFTFSKEGLPPLPTQAPTLTVSHAAFTQQENAQEKASEGHQEQASDESAQGHEKVQDVVSDNPAKQNIQTGGKSNDSAQSQEKGQDGTLEEPIPEDMPRLTSGQPRNTQPKQKPQRAHGKPGDVQRLVNDKAARTNKPGQAKMQERVSKKPAQGNTQKLDKLTLIKRLGQGKKYNATSDGTMKTPPLGPERPQTKRREGSKRMLNEMRKQADEHGLSSPEPKVAYRKLNYFDNVIEDEHQYCFDAIGFVDAFIHRYLTTKQTEALRLPYCVIDHLESTSRIMCYAPNDSGRKLLDDQISLLLKEDRFFVWPNHETQRFESVDVSKLRAHDAFITIAAKRQRTWSNVGQWKKYDLKVYPGLYVPCYEVSEKSWKSIDAESLRQEDMLRSSETKDTELDEIS
ncbi:MAG: hypothetical protein Q9160_009059 [Pyrenula sp. 1 TL-2023]